MKTTTRPPFQSEEFNLLPSKVSDSSSGAQFSEMN